MFLLQNKIKLWSQSDQSFVFTINDCYFDYKQLSNYFRGNSTCIIDFLSLSIKYVN